MLQKFLQALICITLLLISFSYPIIKPINAASKQTATINTATLNVREGPGLSYNVIKQVKQNESYPVVDKKSDWLKLELSKNEFGWVAAWLVSLNEIKSENTSNDKITSSVDGLRIRSGPGTSFQIIGYLNKGEEVSYLDQNENWTKILINNIHGWVSSDYLLFGSTKPNESTKKEGKITATALNIRSTPSLQGAIIGKVYKDEKVTIVSEKENWVEINHDGGTAWIHKDYVRIETTVSLPARPSSPPNDGSTNKQSYTATVTATSLNVRSEGSLEGKVLGTVKIGDSVTVKQELNQWCEISYNGSTGWVACWFLEKNPSIDQSYEAFSEIKIIHNGTNIRTGPSTTNSVALIANEGDTFKVIETAGDWYKIELANKQVAYVAGWIVQIVGSSENIQKPGVNQYLKGRNIIVDPGHGGRDSGTVGVSGTLEKDVTLRTAKLVYDKLVAAGASVSLTRSNDSYVSLRTRVNTSHYGNADAFISIHYDSVNDHSVKGITSYYYKNIDISLAASLQTEIIKATRLSDRGHRSGNYHVLRENRQPAALLELGFLSNSSEELTVLSSGFQENVSSGIYYGLAQYFKSK
ncbi:SH3 domain-containing protein [Bacillus timonensis]|nr:SH3 domain-containing protein [Bacillus timonensis]